MPVPPPTRARTCARAKDLRKKGRVGKKSSSSSRIATDSTENAARRFEARDRSRRVSGEVASFAAPLRNRSGNYS